MPPLIRAGLWIALVAKVKLDGAWGMDYIHLSRKTGKWMIMNVILGM